MGKRTELGISRDEYNSCTVKKKFFDEETAKSILDHLKRNLEEEYKDALQVYKCRYCPFWHIGKNGQVVKSLKEIKRLKEGMKGITRKLTREERQILGDFIGYILNQRESS